MNATNAAQATIFRKKSLSPLAVILSLVLGGGLWSLGQAGRPTPSIPAERFLEEIHHGFQPELAKILFVTERYRNSRLTVVFDGVEYDVNRAIARARSFLRKTYRGEAAEAWVKSHLYRSPTSGQVIYLEFPNGTRRLLRDVLLEELRNLPLS